ncbi:site-specific integrase [Massilia oculi]|uniref:site-specific integrase n=1 Tax=Massilia oculi TaxID=945844 RepID=UPI001AB01B7B|nr:site-specific integrase [Massilia oculi]
MSNSVSEFLSERERQGLPNFASTRAGSKYSPCSESWIFRDGTENISLRFDLLPQVSQQLMLGLKKTLMWYLANRSSKTAEGYFHEFIKLVRFVSRTQPGPVSQITGNNLLEYRNSAERVEFDLAKIRGFLLRWTKLGSAGVESDVSTVLSKWRLRQSPVGVAVATLDPRKGPLTDLEFESILSALHHAYRENSVKLEDLLLAYLFISLGVRPAQIASLKCGDLNVPLVKGGNYILQIPRVKQRQLSRNAFKARKLTVQLGRPLAEHVETVHKRFAERLKNPLDAPMFPRSDGVSSLDAAGYEFHMTSAALSEKIISLFRKLQIPSERLEGEIIPITPTRFRRTFATRAVEEGWPLLVVAELMDHEETRHVEIYAGLTTRIRSSFSRKIASDMAPIAKAFTGRLIKSEEQAKYPGPDSRIIDLRVDRTGAPMGNCGTKTQCGFARPIACYGGCHDFEPWLDGPHQQALDYMLQRREHLEATTDARIAAINDRAILGCLQVIQRCQEILKSENI